MRHIDFETLEGALALPGAPGEAQDPFLRAALEAAQVGTWRVDKASGLGSWDAVTSAVFGLDPVARQDAEPLVSVHPEDRDWVARSLQESFSEGTSHDVEFRIVRACGEVRWVRAIARPVRDADGLARSVCGIAMDVTARRASDEALRESQRQLSTLIGNLPGIAYRCQAEAPWRLDFVSEGAEAITGWPAAQWMAHEISWADIVHRKDGAALLAEVERAIAARSRFSATYRIVRRDGAVRWLHETGAPVFDGEGRTVALEGYITDVTEEKLLEGALRASNDRVHQILEASPDCIKMLDLDGRILFINALGARALNVDDPATLTGIPWTDLLPPENARDVREAIALARKGETAHFTMRWTLPDHAARWWDVVATPVREATGTVSRLVVVSRDISHQKQSEERVRWIANHDTLTGLPSRLLFQERLDQMVRPEEGESHFALLLLDIDEFKRVNDTLGHDAGDALLCAFAERLKEASRKDDLVARLGGDEFAVILNGVASEDEVTAAVDAVMQALRRPWVHGGMVVDCDASIGASLFPKDGDTRAELMKHADIALYVAKAAGRGNLKLFHATMRAEMQNRISMLALARDAIDKDWIVPFYQPKVNLKTGQIAGFEALLRWHHPGNGIQTPDTIAAAFDDLTIASGLSARMIDKVIEDVKRWRSEGVDFRHVAVNASAAEFRTGDFAERLLERLERAGVPPGCLQLEVTETVFLGRGADCVERTLKTLSAEGVTIALDDFGTGYASLSHLQQFPVDLLKIDRSFVRDLGRHPDAAAIVRAVINLGHSLEIGIVAEGIETAAQEARLAAQGCDYGQGYFYSPAVPAADVPAFLAGRADPQPLPQAG